MDTVVTALEATLLNNLGTDGFTLKLGSFGEFSVRHKAGILRKRERERKAIEIGSDKLIDLYTKKMWEYHSPEIRKVKPLLELDSNWTEAGEESGASAQPVVN